MGTNYYAIKKISELEKEDIIKAIRDDNYSVAIDLIPDKIHVGKSSAGWAFLFDHNNWMYFDKNKESVNNFLSECKIFDEYGSQCNLNDFWKMVHNKSKLGKETQYGEIIDGLNFSFSTDFF